MLRITWRTWLIVAAIIAVTLIAVWWAVAIAPAQFAKPLTDEAVGALSQAARVEAEDRRLQSQNAVRTTLLQAIDGVVLGGWAVYSPTSSGG